MTRPAKDVYLRLPQPEDLAARMALGVSAEIVLGYGAIVEDVPMMGRLQAQRWLKGLQCHPHAWVIMAGGALAGEVRLDGLNPGDRRARLAIGLFHQRFLGQGIGRRAIALVLDRAFEHLDLHRVDLRVLASNDRAIRCYLACGFVHEGTERQSARVGTSWEDDWIMSILAPEHAARYSGQPGARQCERPHLAIPSLFANVVGKPLERHRMHHRSVAVFDHFLSTLSAILDKAEAHCAAKKIKPEVILAARLFPDMFAFTRQVQLACDFAARGTARLAGGEPKGFPDTETSFAELQDRITAARGYISGFPAADFVQAPEREIKFKAGGLDTVMTGEDYLSFYCLPQFYFHLTTAYDILRMQGVELGKRDYMGRS